MRIIPSKEYPEGVVDIEKFLTTGEYDQGDVALIDYDDLVDYIGEEKKESFNKGYEEGKNFQPYSN